MGLPPTSVPIAVTWRCSGRHLTSRHYYTRISSRIEDHALAGHPPGTPSGMRYPELFGHRFGDCAIRPLILSSGVTTGAIFQGSRPLPIITPDGPVDRLTKSAYFGTRAVAARSRARRLPGQWGYGTRPSVHRYKFVVPYGHQSGYFTDAAPAYHSSSLAGASSG